MNEVDSLFAKEVSLIEVPYFEPSFLGSLNVMSMILTSQGIGMNDMNNIMCYRDYDFFYVYFYVMCAKF